MIKRLHTKTKLIHLVITLLIYSQMIHCGKGTNSDNTVNNSKIENNIVTSSIKFKGTGRINYTITGPVWNSPNKLINEVVWEFGDGNINSKNKMNPEISEMIAYCSGSAPIIEIYPSTLKNNNTFTAKYKFTGNLKDENNKFIKLFEVKGSLETNENGYKPIIINSSNLPELSASNYNLIIMHYYEINNAGIERISEHPLTITWKCPLHRVPIYKKILVWGADWLNGFYEDKGEKTENELAEKLLFSMSSLADLGYRYGPLSRPSNPDNWTEVFLDTLQSACGEFRAFFMALVETQGIDANWLFFNFRNPSSNWYSMYQTIEIAALGRETKVWNHANHIVVEVNGIVYDPTYLITKPNADEFEDYLFSSFCYGEDWYCKTANDWCTHKNGPQNICTDNKPGYDENLGFYRSRGDNYN